MRFCSLMYLISCLAVAAQGLLKNPEFSVYLTKEDDKQPFILFGDTDPGVYKGTFTYLPVHLPAYAL